MKNVIISGSNEGIGFYAVKELLKEGYRVTALDLKTENLAGLEGEILPLVCDVGDGEQVKAAAAKSFERFGSIDIAVQNACLCTFDSFEDTETETFKKVFNTNYFGAVNLTKAVVPYMKKQGYGKIIFTSSGVGVTGFVNISPYASTKGAIESLAKCLNIEYAADNISFHIFHPPLTKTKSASPLPVPKEFMAEPQKVGEGFAKNIGKKSFIICHSAGQKLQTMGCYLMPVKMGKMMSKMTARYAAQQDKE